MKADKTPTEWPTEGHIDRVGLNGERDYSEPFVTRFASAGAQAEYHYALKLGLPIIFECDEINEKLAN